MNADKDTAPGLVVVWISRDPEAARNMALMYAKNSRLKGWWDTVHLLIWGPSAQLLAGDAALQEEVADCMAAGVTVAPAPTATAWPKHWRRSASPCNIRASR